MVEGPGCFNNGKKARVLVGKRIVGINGQVLLGLGAMSAHCRPALSPANPSPFMQEAKKVATAVRSRILLSVITLGKVGAGPQGMDVTAGCTGC